MKILGVNPGIYPPGLHDPSAVLVENGKVLYAVEEERYNRSKHSFNTFPTKTVRNILEKNSLTLSDLDHVAVPWQYEKKLDTLRFHLRKAITTGDSTLEKAALVKNRLEEATFDKFGRSKIADKLSQMPGHCPDIVYHRHHRCHAASAFYPSGFEQALVVSVDGRGEDEATVVWSADESGLQRIHQYEYPNSLGVFYGMVTDFLGYRAQNGEGKVMGLAPYGNENPQIRAALRKEIECGAKYDVTAITDAGLNAGVERLEKILDRPRSQESGKYDQWEKDLAYEAQRLIEEIMQSIVTKYISESGLSKVALAGGVALNCKMNKRIRELEVVDDLFVQPVSHDAGSALGAAWLPFDPHSVESMETVYWGPEYDNKKIRTLLETNKLTYETPDDLEATVAASLADGKLIGWFQGRMEMGPRALGNRSILADPRSQSSLDRVNEYVKHREGWRPFAPSMLAEAADEYLVDASKSPYMIETFDVREDKQNEIIAVLHPADQTTRPQTVTPEQNKRYHQLISEFQALTGVPVVLNTSFNDNGEPIVNRPVEALKDFYGMGLDMLVLNDYVLSK